MVDKMVDWMNEHAASYIPNKKDTQLGRTRPWRPTTKRELYAYFRAVIYIGVVVQPNMEDYWGRREEGALDYLKSFISLIKFQQLDRHIKASSMPEDSFQATFNCVDI
jgi:hypothetical protein